MEDVNRKTLLLVEDEAIIALLEAQQLENAGYRVLNAYSGEQAVQLVQEWEEPIDLILMDINLGKGIDGTEAARRILRMREIPIVFLSSHTEKEMVEKTEQISFYGYVVKNSSPTVLVAMIKMAFRLHESRSRLEASEARYRRLVEGSPDTLYTFSSTRGGVYYSSHVVDLLGYPLEQIYAQPYLWNESIHPDDLPRIVTAVRDFEQGLSFDVEYRIRDSRGGWHWLRDRSIGRRLEGDEVLLEGLASDITARVELEAALRDSQEKYRTLFELFPMGVTVGDRDGRILESNLEAERLLELPNYEQRQRKVDGPEWRLLRPDGTAMLPEEFASVRALKENRLVGPVVMGIVKDPQPTTWIEVTAAPLADGGVMIAYQDIAGRERAAEALRQSEDRFRIVFENAPDAMLLADAQTGIILDANRSASRLLGKPQTEIRGLHQSQLHPPPVQGFSGETFAQHSQALGESQPVQSEMLRADGSRVTVEVLDHVIQLGGRPVLMGTFRDITARKRAEDQIKSLLREKELLLKEVHHRVKNNMTTISSLLQLQLAGQTEPSARAVLQDAAGRVQSMMVLYETLFRSDNFNVVSIRRFIPDLLGEVSKLYSPSANIHIQTHLEDILLPPQLLSPLGLILNELLTNTFKYAFVGRAGGTIRIKVQRVGEQIGLEFADDGVGLPDGVDLSHSSGFGMRLVGMLVKQLDGQATIDLVHGTSYRIEFPVE